MKSLFLVGALLMTPGIAAAQSAKDWAAGPRTSWGVPNLQGVWDFRTATPIERPDELAGKTTLTDQEAARFEQTFARGVVPLDERPRLPQSIRNGRAMPVVIGRATLWWLRRPTSRIRRASTGLDRTCASSNTSPALTETDCVTS